MLIDSTVPYHCRPYSTILGCNAPYYTVLYLIVPNPTQQYRKLINRTVLYSTVSYSTVPYWIRPHYTIVYLTRPYRTQPYRAVISHSTLGRIVSFSASLDLTVFDHPRKFLPYLLQWSFNVKCRKIICIVNLILIFVKDLLSIKLPRYTFLRSRLLFELLHLYKTRY